jgi:hypothetical protein
MRSRMTDETRELRRIIRASVRDMLDVSAVALE